MVVRIAQVRGAISEGEPDDEPRENVIDALRELVAAARFGSPRELPGRADSEWLELTSAAWSR